MCSYICVYICVVAHICKVISLKSKVSQAKVLGKTYVVGLVEDLFCGEKIVMVSEAGYLATISMYNLRDYSFCAVTAADVHRYVRIFL